MTLTYYIYRLTDKTVMARIDGDSNAACETKADELYDSNDYGGTYSPAFGAVSGLIDDPNAPHLRAT